MKKSRPIIITCLAIITPIAVIVGAAWWLVYAISPPDINKAEKMFKNDCILS